MVVTLTVCMPHIMICRLNVDVRTTTLLFFTLQLDGANGVATEELDFSLSCIGSTDGVCPCTCDYATDASCTCRDLQQTLVVTLTKTPVWASYPLTYLASFNYEPYEVIQVWVIDLVKQLL